MADIQPEAVAVAGSTQLSTTPSSPSGSDHTTRVKTVLYPVFEFEARGRTRRERPAPSNAQDAALVAQIHTQMHAAQDALHKKNDAEWQKRQLLYDKKYRPGTTNAVMKAEIAARLAVSSKLVSDDARWLARKQKLDRDNHAKEHTANEQTLLKQHHANETSLRKEIHDAMNRISKQHTKRMKDIAKHTELSPDIAEEFRTKVDKDERAQLVQMQTYMSLAQETDKQTEDEQDKLFETLEHVHTTHWGEDNDLVSQYHVQRKAAEELLREEKNKMDATSRDDPTFLDLGAVENDSAKLARALAMLAENGHKLPDFVVGKTRPAGNAGG